MEFMSLFIYIDINFKILLCACFPDEAGMSADVAETMFHGFGENG